MNKFLLPILLAVGIGSAFAQTDTTNVSNDKIKVNAPPMTPAEQAADHHCLRYTGTRIHSSTPTRASKASDCATVPGTAYSREDIDRTGDVSTADALRHLDPSITTHH